MSAALRLTAFLLGAAALSAAPAPTKALADRLRDIVPSIADSILVCRVNTEGLPGPAARETILSGLPSAMTLGLSLLDHRGKSVNQSQVEIRIEPDLWEQIFLVRTPLFDSRLSSLSGVEDLLRSLPDIPVVTARTLTPGDRYRIRVRLAVHALAPSQLRQSRAAYFEGDLGESERREVSIGLGSLLRYFLDGDDDDETWLSESSSDWFRLSDLLSAPALPPVKETP